MKRSQNTAFLVLLALSGALATSCTKENTQHPTCCQVEEHSVSYTIGGQTFYANPKTDEEWSAFIQRMLALAREGYTVSFSRDGVGTSLSKLKETFTTTNPEEAEAWCKQKREEGYTVTITFDQGTGEYTCIAIK